jgi:2-dehydro-3-deoxy-D-arabinonate dehydratase
MRLCRFVPPDRSPDPSEAACPGLVTDAGAVIDLKAAGWHGLSPLLERDDLIERLRGLMQERAAAFALSEVRLLCPLERQEVWAAGVTYLRSRAARMEESSFSASAYDRVYEADRPELFFKALPQKTVGPGAAVGIRQDARWSVPEPELALVLNSRGKIAGLTIGNDLSARDIEGENLLYLPQAKIYERSCAIGPWITVGVEEPQARSWLIDLEIRRRGEVVYRGGTTVAQIRRSFDDLAAFLFRSQKFPDGAVLLTGTGVVPPDDFALCPGDSVRIDISGIGTLENPVVAV